MAHPLLQSICDAVDGAQLMCHIGELAKWIKLSGSEGEAASLRTIRGHLDAYGFRTTALLHDAYISLPGKSRVDMDGTAPASITHSFSRSSPPGG